MDRWCISRSGNGLPHVRAVFVYALVLLAVLIVDCGPASALPAFARKYGMPCSACHEAWPMLSPFGQQFKDNGYQMANDRDAPIFQQAAYWPVTFRITPVWHRESSNGVQVDGTSGRAEAYAHFNGIGDGRNDHGKVATQLGRCTAVILEQSLVGFRSLRARKFNAYP